jgi:hypothetical protein
MGCDGARVWDPPTKAETGVESAGDVPWIVVGVNVELPITMGGTAGTEFGWDTEFALEAAPPLFGGPP